MSDDADVRGRALTGLGWSARSTLFQQVVQFGFGVVLARILVPTDFGLFALMTVFTGFASLFMDFGFSSAIIQRTAIDERYLSSAFWLSLSGGAGVMLVTMALAPGLTAFYGQPRLLALTLAFAPVFFIGSVSGVQRAILQREMNFKKLAVIENSARVGASAIAIGMAYAGLGVWSLVGLYLATAVLNSALLWQFGRWRPSVRPDRKAMAELWRFSSRLTGFNVVNYWARNADNLLIGRFIGVSQLGFYNRAYTLMLLPSDVATSATDRVMYSALSRLKDDHVRVRRVYLDVVGLLSLALFPAIVGLFVVCKPFILTVYGPKWLPAVPLLQILCLASLMEVLARTTGMIFTSQGRTDLMFRWGVVSSITAIGSFFIGLPWGVRGITIGFTCWSVLMTYPLFATVGKLIDLSMMDVIRAISGISIASAVMGLATWIVQVNLPADWGEPARLGVGVLVGMATYVIALQIVRPPPWGRFKQLLGDYRRR